MELYIYTILFFCLGNIILSLHYFLKVKERWRYIKLWYVFANAVIMYLISGVLLGKNPTQVIQLVGLIILLSSQFAGMIVSVAKVKVANNVTVKKLADKLND